MLTIKY